MLSYQSVILVGRGEFLGHVISDEGSVVDPSEVDVVLLLGVPNVGYGDWKLLELN